MRLHVKQRISPVSVPRMLAATMLCLWLNVTVMPHATTFVSHELPVATDLTLLRVAIVVSAAVAGVAASRSNGRATAKVLLLIAIPCLFPDEVARAVVGNAQQQAVLTNVMSFLNGIGIGAFLVAVSATYRNAVSATVLLETAVAMSASILLFGLSLFVSGQLASLIAYLCALVAIALVYGLVSKEDASSLGDGAKERRDGIATRVFKRSFLLPVGLFCFGFILASGHFLYYSQSLDSSQSSAGLVVVSVLLVSVLVAVVLAMFSLTSSFKMRWIVLIPLVFSCTFLPSIASSASGYSVLLVSEIVFFLYLSWILAFDLPVESDRFVPLFAGLSIAAGQAGMLVGIQLGYGVNIAHPLDDMQKNAFYAVIVLLAFLATVVSLRAFAPCGSDDELKSTETAQSTEGAVQKRCVELCRKAGISDRTTEVTTLYVLGRSRPRIAQMLFISESTVNFHLRKAYQELGVSSKQELLDLVYKDDSD